MKSGPKKSMRKDRARRLILFYHKRRQFSTHGHFSQQINPKSFVPCGAECVAFSCSRRPYHWGSHQASQTHEWVRHTEKTVHNHEEMKSPIMPSPEKKQQHDMDSPINDSE